MNIFMNGKMSKNRKLFYLQTFQKITDIFGPNTQFGHCWRGRGRGACMVFYMKYPPFGTQNLLENCKCKI